MAGILHVQRATRTSSASRSAVVGGTGASGSPAEALRRSLPHRLVFRSSSGVRIIRPAPSAVPPVRAGAFLNHSRK